MTARKKATGTRTRKAPAKKAEQRDVPPHVTTQQDDGLVHVTPVAPGDPQQVAALAGLLLGAAGSPSEVRTTTAPQGWVVTAAVADAAGLN